MDSKFATVDKNKRANPLLRPSKLHSTGNVTTNDAITTKLPIRPYLCSSALGVQSLPNQQKVFSQKSMQNDYIVAYSDWKGPSHVRKQLSLPTKLNESSSTGTIKSDDDPFANLGYRKEKPSSKAVLTSNTPKKNSSINNISYLTSVAESGFVALEKENNMSSKVCELPSRPFDINPVASKVVTLERSKNIFFKSKPIAQGVSGNPTFISSNVLSTSEQVVVSQPLQSDSLPSQNLPADANAVVTIQVDKSHNAILSSYETFQPTKQKTLTNPLSNQNISFASIKPVKESVIDTSQSSAQDICHGDDAIDHSILNLNQKDTGRKRKRDNITENLVSTNFVRLNLKNKRGACRGSKTKRLKNDVFRRRGDSLRSESNRPQWQSQRETGEGYNDNDITILPTNKSSPHGLSGLGVDALVLSLESYEAHDCDRDVNPIDNSRTNDIQKALASGKLTLKKLMNDKLLLQDIAPHCPGHQIACKLLRVSKKTSNNKGKRFYACSYPRDQQCKFFMWAEDNPHFAQVTVDRSINQSVNRVDYLLQRYHQRLSDMSVRQLHAEIVKYQRRREYFLRLFPHVQFFKPSAKGNKESLINDLLVIAEQLMDDPQHSICPKYPPKSSGKVEKLLKKVRGQETQSYEDENDCDDLESIDVSSDDNSKSLYTNDDDDDDDDEEDDDDHIEETAFESMNEKLAPEISINHSNLEHKIYSSTNKENDVHQSVEKAVCHEMTDTKDLSIYDGNWVELSDDDEEEEGMLCVVQSSQCTKQHDESPAKKGSIFLDRIYTLSYMDVLRLYFGFESFRPGQEWAIQRTLAGERSLLVAATGMGKSLCYTLPALILPGITIVVSPLVSLMEDQAHKLPPELPSVVLKGSTTTFTATDIVDKVMNHKVKVIYLSPERLCSGAFQRLIKLLRQKSSSENIISLLCIDEAHCLSQWSYNFRPAFLNIKKSISCLQPYSILALTATAVPTVQREISRHLRIDESTGITSSNCSRENLILQAQFIENDDQKYQVIERIIKKASNNSEESMKRKATKSKDSKNIIIYSWRRQDAESLTAYLQALGYSVGCYHAGLPQAHRMKIQQQFETGYLSIIVATIAFGMGIDKADVNMVIHSYLPSSVEDYSQQIGRAGRNGGISQCYLLANSEECLIQHALTSAHRPSQLQIMLLTCLLFSIKKGQPLNEPIEVEECIALSLETNATQLGMTSTSLQTYLSIFEERLAELSSRDQSSQEVRIDINQQMFYNHIEGNFRDNLKSLRNIQHQYKPLIDILLSRGLGNNQDYHDVRQGEISFDTSLFQVSRQLKISIDETIKQLYILQRDGILQYSLSDWSCSIHVYQTSRNNEERDAIIRYGNKNEYISDIIAISRDIFDRISVIDNLNAKRVLDMHRIAKVIESASANGIESHPTSQVCHKDRDLGSLRDRNSMEDDDEDVMDSESDNREEVSVQEDLRQLLSGYLMSNSDDTKDDIEKQMGPMSELYWNVPAPFTIPSQSEIKTLQRDLEVLFHDPDIVESANRLCMKLYELLGTEIDLNTYRIQHKSLLVFKVVYGADSSSSSSETGKSSWKSSPYFGKHRNIDPNTIMNLLQDRYQS